MIVGDGNDLLALLMFVSRVPEAIAPFLATVLVPSPWRTLIMKIATEPVLFTCNGAVCLTSSRGRQLHGSGLVLQGLLLPWTHNFSQGIEDRCGQPLEATLPCWLCARTSCQYCRSA